MEPLKDKDGVQIHDTSFRSSQNISQEAPASAWIRFWRKVYRPMGFRKGYNFPLFIIFAGALTGFILSRLQDLAYNSGFKDNSIPGKWYWLHDGHYRVGMLMHLATILPAGLLVVYQFVPVIRQRWLLFHRINGHVVILLLLVSNISAMMIARRAAGGDLSTQAIVGILTLSTTGSVAMAYHNIKVKQIDQHRAWMLRAWFYASEILTMRIIMQIAVPVITRVGTYYGIWSCDQVKFTIGYLPLTKTLYPMCFIANGSNHGNIAIQASEGANDPAPIGVAFDLSFGMAAWVALFIHAVGVEIYLKLTPREAQRLRHISYEKQLEAGYKDPGSAGLVIEKFGDADPWIPQNTSLKS